MDEDSTFVGTYMFRGIEYVVTMHVTAGSSLVVEVEDKLTADQWRGTFDATYIEDLTHKTGNFKQFSIFVSMLQVALTQNSDSVSLDLLTYADLESLRNRKSGIGTQHIPGAKVPALNSKRYLILTYTVEFDRIHYPLPLPYMGKPDPRGLQDTIRQLRLELKKYKDRNTSDYKHKAYEKLQRDYNRLLAEKEELEAEFTDYKREVRNSSKGNTVKEIRILKDVVKTLEEDQLKEKARHQRSSSKRNQEYRKLLDEVEELRASERNLRVRVKSLTNELAMYRRRGSTGQSPSGSVNTSRASRGSHRNTSSFLRDRSSSRERSLTHNTSRHSAGSRERSVRSDRSSNRNSYSRERSVSRERRTQSQNISRSSAGSYRLRTPSPSGTRYPRFDPTAYVKDREQKKREATLKQKRQQRSRTSGSLEKKPRPSPSLSERSYGRTGRVHRSSSAGSIHSRASSIESINGHNSNGNFSDTSEGRLKKINKVLKTDRTSSSAAWSSPDVSYEQRNAAKPKKILSSTPDAPNRARQRTKASLRDKENAGSDAVDSDYFDRSSEMYEIDARLSRLQQLMKSNMP